MCDSLKSCWRNEKQQLFLLKVKLCLLRSSYYTPTIFYADRKRLNNGRHQHTTKLCLASATTCECSSIVTLKLHTLHRSFYCHNSQYLDPTMFVSEWNEEGQVSNQSARPSPLRRRGLRETSGGRPASPWLQQRTGVTCLTTSSCRSSSTCPS